MTPTSYLIWEQWEALVALFQAQMGSGGALDGIMNIQQSIQLIPGTLPAIGVQWLDATPTDIGGGKKQVTTTFAIIVGTQSKPTQSGANTQQPTLANAFAQMQAFVEDIDTGSGVISILKDPANFTLGGLCNTTEITGLEADWRVQPAAATGGASPASTGIIEAYVKITIALRSGVASFT